MDDSADVSGSNAPSATETGGGPTIAGYDTSRDEEYARLLQAQEGGYVHYSQQPVGFVVPHPPEGSAAYYYGTWRPPVPRYFHARDEWYEFWMGMIFVVFCLSFILLTISIIYYST